MVALAGINSSEAEQLRGNNEHMRSFQIGLPSRHPTNPEKGKPKKKKPLSESQSQSKGATTPLARVSMFRTYSKDIKPGQKVDTYQRLLKVSRWRKDGIPRLGAIATGLAPFGELVLFRVASKPQVSDVVGRINVGTGVEVEDLDIVEIEKGNFKVAYTTGVDVFTFTISPSAHTSDASPEVSCVYTMPLLAARGGKTAVRSKARSLRFLSSDTLLLLQNEPNRTGCELVLVSLPTKGTKPRPGGPIDSVLQRKKLRKSMKIGLGLDVCDLGTNPETERQWIVAVSGSDQAIDVFTIEYSPSRKQGYSRLARYVTLSDVHPFSMTRICFSSFQPPPHPVTSKVRPQYVRLATTSMGNTVVVHTFSLSPYSASSQTPRYVLARPGQTETSETLFSAFVAILIIGISCFLLQAFTEIRGGVPAYLGAANWLPERMRDMIARPYMYEHGQPVIPEMDIPQLVTGEASISSLTSSLHMTPTPSPVAVPLRELLVSRLSFLSKADAITAATTTMTPTSSVVRNDHDPETDLIPSSIPTPGILIIINHDDTSLTFHTHDDESAFIVTNSNQPADASDSLPAQAAGAKRWEHLTEEQRKIWKKRLVDTGHWAVEEGEAILGGVFFGELGAMGGDAIRG